MLFARTPYKCAYRTVYPPQQRSPAGPEQIYRFTAVTEGEAQIRIPHRDSNPTVTLTIQVTNL
jgi:hypothetical protein